VGSAIDVDRAHADPLFVLMEGHGDGCCVVGNSRKDRLRASVLQQFCILITPLPPVDNHRVSA
jgi:hypothetical protein